MPRLNVHTNQILEYTCSKYCNLISLSEVYYSHRDLQAKIETYNFYKIALISKKNKKKTSLFSVLLLSETELFSQLALILLPHTFPSSCYCCLVGSGGSFNRKSWVKVATKETLVVGHCYEVLKAFCFPKCILNNLETFSNGLYGI